MTIRAAIASDLPALNQISYRAKQSWGYPKAWMKRWKTDLTLTADQLNQWQVWVGIINEQPVGFCALSESTEGYIIEHLWVLPEHMGKGYGRALLEHALSQLLDTAKPVLVLSDPHAEAFYARLGFSTIAQQESYPPGRFLPLMRKDR